MNGETSPSSSPIASSSAAGPEPGGRARGGAVINPGRRELWEPDTEHFPSLADRARASTRHVIKNGLASPTHSAHATFFRPHTNASITKASADRRAKKVDSRRCNAYTLPTRGPQQKWEFPFPIFPVGMPWKWVCHGVVLERECEKELLYRIGKSKTHSLRPLQGVLWPTDQASNSTVNCYPDHHTVCLKLLMCSVKFVRVVYS